MLLIYDGLLGYVSNYTAAFIGADSKESYQKKLQENPVDWYYKNLNISYKYNSIGHRCADIHNIDFTNYILFLGCSHTEGIGNRLEDTYPYLLANKLKIDYYNLALGGSSNDYSRHNLTVWLAKFPPPKYIIWQWTVADRFVALKKDHFLNVGPWVNDDPILQKALVQNSMYKTFQHRDYLIAEYLHQVNKKIPVIQVAVPFIPFPKNTSPFLFNGVDRARDNHFGVDTHKNLSENLYSIMLNTVCEK